MIDWFEHTSTTGKFLEEKEPCRDQPGACTSQLLGRLSGDLLMAGFSLVPSCM